jgi:hypothetical protein
MLPPALVQNGGCRVIIEGARCPACGGVERYATNNACVSCCRRRAKEYYYRHRQPQRARTMVGARPCRRCGSYERYILSGKCVPCARKSRTRRRLEPIDLNLRWEQDKAAQLKSPQSVSSPPPSLEAGFKQQEVQRLHGKGWSVWKIAKALGMGSDEIKTILGHKE